MKSKRGECSSEDNAYTFTFILLFSCHKMCELSFYVGVYFPKILSLYLVLNLLVLGDLLIFCVIAPSSGVRDLSFVLHVLLCSVCAELSRERYVFSRSSDVAK